MTTCDNTCVVNNCSGAIGSGSRLTDYWRLNDCPNAYAQFINTGPSGTLEYNPAQQLIAQEKVAQLFNTYFITNTLTDDVTSPSFDVFQNTLLSLCTDKTLPGICNQFLTSYCVGATGFTRQQVINSPTLTNFCGCYIPPDQNIVQFTKGTPQCAIGATGCTGCTGGTGTTGTCVSLPACDPLCHRALTSQKAFQPTGNIITCPQTICAISGVTINAKQSNIPGGINFNTICSGCGVSCACIVSSTNINVTFSQIGVGTNFGDFCGSNSVCIVEDSFGNIISATGCTGINPSNLPIPVFATKPNAGIIFIMILLVLVILFIAIASRYPNT